MKKIRLKDLTQILNLVTAALKAIVALIKVLGEVVNYGREFRELRLFIQER